MPKRNVGPTSKYTVKPLDEEMFFTLWDILHDGCFSGNYSATARVLGISILSARKYTKTPPRNPWMNHILTHAIQAIYLQMTQSSHKRIRKRAKQVSAALQRAELHKLKDYIDFNEANNSEVRRHLLTIVASSPDSQISTRDLRKPANSGGYSMRALREAAVQLCLDKVTVGFGDEKETFYRLPIED